MVDNSMWGFIAGNLYILKQQYGAEVTVYKMISNEVNPQTGVKSISRELYPVHRAIMLPEQENRQVEQGIAVMSANKYFTAQAGFDLGMATFIFDSADLPSGFKFTLDDFVLMGCDYYKVSNVEDYEYDSGWVVKTHRVEGANLRVVLNEVASNTLTVDQTTSVTKEIP